MTIIVYDPIRDVIYSDTETTFTSAGKPLQHDASKLRRSPSGLRYVSTGSLDLYVGRVIDEIEEKGFVEGLPSLKTESSIFYRNAFNEFRYVVHVDDRLVAESWNLSQPLSRGAGFQFFDAYWFEHRDVLVALDLTLKHAYACGGSIDSF